MTVILGGILLAVTVPARFGTTGSFFVVSEMVVWLLGLTVAALACRWAFGQLHLSVALFLVGLGAVFSSLFQLGQTDNWWKFAGSTGVTVIALLLVDRLRPFIRRGTLFVLIFANLTMDFRSMAVLCIVVLLVDVLSKPVGRLGARRPASVLLYLSGIVGITAITINQVIVSGLAGAGLQERAVRQTALGQNPILGGRTEWGATMELMRIYPPGFGVGSTPSTFAMSEAMTGVRGVGGDTAGPYFYSQVFGDRVDLHSSLANVWFHFGVLGFVAAAIVGLYLLLGVTRIFQNVRPFEMAVAFLGLLACWDLLFSPMASAASIAVAAGAIGGSRPSAKVIVAPTPSNSEYKSAMLI
ncbi:hypothetical protein E3T23_03450 [Cryobacterium cheniae]|uniref:O-antigen ligase domain-containing protein n=1 Tax=Cryobacterium cheniae TaxID=1259262 RepID=A0A4R8XYT3_9MICO|nr:hypothetical protein [Cryobacterium cheniae]TFC82994.1 hypothetical protein E3T23_03450 [Cryobacterium cheniae]